jgi:hypothetical protein
MASANPSELQYIFDKLAWLRACRIWPNGMRYLWTDAFGVVLLVSLYAATGQRRYLDEAEALIESVYRVLGRSRGIRIGEAPDRDGQYFHYLAMWMFALSVIGRHVPDYRTLGIELARQIHNAFVIRGRGVLWKMTEDLSGPYPGYGFGALDAFDGYVSYRKLGDAALSSEIADMKEIIDRVAPDLLITQDLGIGMMLWMTHFFPDEPWAISQKTRCLRTLDEMWIADGYFCREPQAPTVKFAFTNYGVSIGLQAVQAMPERIQQLHHHFERFRSGDSYDEDAITHVMACCSHFPGYFLRDFEQLA